VGVRSLAKRKEAPEEKASTETVPDKEVSEAVKPSTKSEKKGKLPPKNKSRLPRRLKKAQHKAAGRL
jgi:hypothetical protein